MSLECYIFLSMLFSIIALALFIWLCCSSSFSTMSSVGHIVLVFYCAVCFSGGGLIPALGD